MVNFFQVSHFHGQSFFLYLLALRAREREREKIETEGTRRYIHAR